MRSEENKEGERKSVDIHPLTRGKRALSFLADFFIIFILSLVLFNLGSYPLASVITKGDDRYNSYLVDARERDSVLYDNSLLFFENSSDKEPSSFSANLAYTCKRFVSYYVLEESEREENCEVFATYYENLRSKTMQISTIYSEIDAKGLYFSFDEGFVSLKEPYKSEFLPLFRAGDALSSKGQSDYGAFEREFFLQAYSKMLLDIKENDLKVGNVSYAEKQRSVDSYIRYSNNLIVVCALIAYLIAVMVDALLFPIVSSRRKTLGNMLLRYERVDIKTFRILPKSKALLFFVYMFALSSLSLVFVPWGIVTFNELFSFSLLFTLSIIGLVLDIISLAFLLFDSFGRSLMDRLTFSVMVSQDTLGEICRAKGYDY